MNEIEPRTRDAAADRVAAALRRVGEIWEARLASDWTPPEGSTFPWAQVRLSLAALVPGLAAVVGGRWSVVSGEGEEREYTLSAEAWCGSLTTDHRPPTTSPQAALILAGNTPLLSWSPLCACLLAGWRVRVKMSRGETLWPRLFWEALDEADPEVAARVVLEVWAGDDPRTAELVQSSDAVIAFGSDATLAALRDLTPTGTPFFGFGHAVSIGLLMPGYTREEWCAFTRDVLMYDQGGCLSPHLLLESPDVPGSGTEVYGGKEFAWELQQEADALGVAPVTDPAVARAVREARDMATFEGLEVIGHANGRNELRFSVICDYDATPAALPFPAGHGTVYLVPGDPRLLAERLGPLRGRVSCVGVAGHLPDDIREMLIAQGVSRICRAGEMQMPWLDWPNGNIDLLAELRRVMPADRQGA